MSGSWKTTVVGYGVILLAVIQQALADNPLPNNAYDWITFGGKIIMGVGISLAKDYNKTNAVNATAESKTVPEAK